MAFIIIILSLVAWLWMIVIAFKHDQIIWGIAMILIIPVCFLYGVLNFNRAMAPLILMALSIGLFFTLTPEQLAEIASE